MEQKTEEEQVKKSASTFADGKIGKDISGKVEEAAQRESPLDEVRRLHKENKEMVEKMNHLKEDLIQLSAFAELSGRSFAGNPPRELTPEEHHSLAVKDLSKMLTANYIK